MVPWLEWKFILLFKYISFAKVKKDSQKDVFILAGAMMKVISILKDEKRQYNVNRKAATLSALPPGKMLQVKMYFLLIKVE